MLDRIDLLSLVLNSLPQEGTQGASGACMALRDRVESTSAKLRELWGDPPGTLSPARLEAILEEIPRIRDELGALATSSLRGRHKILRVALTLSALDGVEIPRPEHLLEASCYRPERFGFWA